MRELESERRGSRFAHGGFNACKTRGATPEVTKPLNYRLVPLLRSSRVRPGCNREVRIGLVSIRRNISEADVPKGFSVMDVSHNTRSRLPADQTIFFSHLVPDDEGVAIPA